QALFTELINAHRANYAETATDVGTLPGEEFAINLKPGTIPISKKPYPHCHAHNDEIKRQIRELKQAGFIEEAESEWASPLIVVPKPTRNGKKEWRMCVDYRGLNAHTIKDTYRVPSMRDLYHKVRGAKWFSALDVRSGYHHIKVRKADQKKTCFIDGEGKTYLWKRMCFGFKNAPATFQRAMDKIFGHLDYVVVYIDDIIICSSSLEEHSLHLQEVFALLSKHNLKLRLEKC
ncbi:MAG: RNA-directed DNA polymerase, partial [Planctomycetes bacterium]|nr:RNA-directed DNA polymerase [Planctomycetota bacterium]